jgi:hypothetical protein
MDTEDVAVDFRADPDGDWDYDTLLEAAGFAKEAQGVRIGALAAGFRGHAEGSAVVSELDGELMSGRYFAIVELREAFVPDRVRVHELDPRAALLCVLPMSLPQDREAAPSRAA